MKVKYVGPFDAVEVAGLVVLRDAVVDVASDVAGVAPDERRAVAMSELTAAMQARDGVAVGALTAELEGLSAGAGLLAQSDWVAVSKVSKEPEE